MIIFGFPIAPFFVVISTAPLPARTPYKAVAAAPLRIVMEEMSCGLMSIALFELSTPATPFPTELLSMGMPSITNKGEFDPFMELLPLILILDEAPGEPDELTTVTPAILELSASTRFTSLADIISSVFTFWMA